MSEVLQLVARELVNDLARGSYQSVLQRCVKSRLTIEDIRRVIGEYGRTLVTPPVDAYSHLDAVEVAGSIPETWSVRVPLWTKEEGPSDLTLELAIALRDDGPTVELDDLHVL
jgi:hypothetical protein